MASYWQTGWDVGKKVNFYKGSTTRSLVVHTKTVESKYDAEFKVQLQRLDLNTLPLECGYTLDWIESVKTLRFVSVLNLKECGLTQLPSEIGDMTALRRLRVEQNHLTLLPDTIEKLTELRVLNAYGNQLKALPSGMYKLYRLRVLRLGGNRLIARDLVVLSNRDRDFRMLRSSLSEIYLRDNPLLVINEIPESFREALTYARQVSEWVTSIPKLDIENCPDHSASQTKAVEVN